MPPTSLLDAPDFSAHLRPQGASPRGRHGESRRRLTAAVGALALAACLGGAVAGCGLRVGEPGSTSLPTQSAAEAARDGLARVAFEIEQTASLASGVDPEAAAVLEKEISQGAGRQLSALGEVWQPWPSGAPSAAATASPLATPTTGTASDLVAVLSSGAEAAIKATASEKDASRTRLYASLAVQWSLWARSLAAAAGVEAPAAVASAARTPSTLTEGLDGDLLRLYDQARYAMEEVAARSSDSDRERAGADAAVAKAVVDASIAAGSEDSRLAAYAAPAPAEGSEASAEVTWARQVWIAVAEGEISAVGTEEGAAREAGIRAAIDAALRAQAWGGALSQPLPGYSSH